MVYGELGRYPLSVVIKVRTVALWYKLVNGNLISMVENVLQILNVNVPKYLGVIRGTFITGL